MSSFTVDEVRARVLGGILPQINYVPDDFISWTPFREDRFREMHFLFFLTSIDHNTHGAERYEMAVEGGTVHGSELMYWQAQQAALQEADLFTPQLLGRVTDHRVREIFTTATGKVPAGIEERAHLLRDAATLLCEKYGGDLANLLERGEGYLRRGDGRGIMDLLKEIRAFSDPLEKKSFLIVKLLRRRGFIEVRDPENLNVPVDHVLFTLGLRSGMVVAEASVGERIMAGRPLDEEEVKNLRGATREAYGKLAEFAGISVDLFDDLLWAYGRECLRLPRPLPEEKIAGIQISLDFRVGNRQALNEFLKMMNGLDPGAPEGAKLYPLPVFSANFFF